MIVNLFKQIRWWNWAIPFLVVILGLLALLLVRDATTAILESADGEFEEVVLDPLAPGYETYVTSTPTHLMIIENRDQKFVSAALLSLFVNEIGGTAVILPGELLITSETSIEETYNQGTIENPKTGYCNGFCVNGYLPLPSGVNTHNFAPRSAYRAVQLTIMS